LALNVGLPTHITWLISRLRSKNTKLANSLFVQTIAAGRQSLDSELLHSLARKPLFPTMRPGWLNGYIRRLRAFHSSRQNWKNRLVKKVY